MALIQCVLRGCRDIIEFESIDIQA